MVLSEKQQEKVQVCEENWKRRIVGGKRADKSKMDELKVEARDEKWARRPDAQKVEEIRRRGRPRVRWEGLMSHIWNEWQENSRNTQQEVETVDRERSDRKVRKENTRQILR